MIKAHKLPDPRGDGTKKRHLWMATWCVAPCWATKNEPLTKTTAITHVKHMRHRYYTLRTSQNKVCLNMEIMSELKGIAAELGTMTRIRGCSNGKTMP
ncbi:hypothetical protein PIB30_086862 [Stylosanthes scabra]|uniref:Uncharacterized protein n=1 Tax=Stylosanthes scabra TaxID=79078 RepID=A0ABU6YQW1_9FABA|nr:hypothetical protein [Stylosanthes scabra]